jgi:hypothetical protein
MIGIEATQRLGWLAAALGALAVVLVALAPGGLDLDRPGQQSALEHCRAEATRAFLVKYQPAGSRSLADCLARQGH